MGMQYILFYTFTTLKFNIAKYLGKILSYYMRQDKRTDDNHDNISE